MSGRRPEGVGIKQVQVQLDGRGRTFVTFALEGPAAVFRARSTGQGEVGIDAGLKKFAALSHGTFIENPRHLQRSADRLARVQRVLSRRRKGSKRYRKARRVVARIHGKVRDQRLDFHHQASARLVNASAFIAVEDLNIKGLARGMLAGSVHDAGWAEVISFLKYKAESAGTRVEEVKASGTSQECPECGRKKKKAVREREHVCPCGCHLDRDTAASRVILSRARAAWTRPSQMATAEAAA